MTRMKKTIAILLAVLFLLTVTAGAVSAAVVHGGKPVIIAIGHNVAGLEVAKDKNPLIYVTNKGSGDTSQITNMASTFNRIGAVG